MDENIARLEKYNLWGAETIDFGFKRNYISAIKDTVMLRDKDAK